MSDDLISRKALLEVIDISFIIPILKMNLRPEHEAVLKIREITMNMPTAFDKENVIDELVELRQREYNDYDDEPETLDGEEIYDEGRSQGRFEAYHRAIEIVEKGGIE